MKKDGFTLVELLAVIIIIGVIASIAIVSIDKTLKNSKNNLHNIQVDNIIEAAKTYYIKEGMDRGTTCVNVSELTIKDYIENKEVIDPKTKKAMNGSVNISNKNGKTSYEYKDNQCVIIYRPATVENKTLAGKIPQGNLDLGDEYIVNVDGTHEYHFYVLSTEGDKVNLILSGNICSDGTLATESNKCTKAWVSKEDYNDDINYGEFGNSNKGPITAINYVYETTKNWSNIENIQINYTDEGNQYGTITTNGNTTTITNKDGIVTATYTNLKARIPKVSEIEGTGCITNDASCPTWMVNGLDAYISKYPTGTKEDIEGIVGYWSLSSVVSTDNFNSFYAWNVYHNGILDVNNIDYDNNLGIRPVITVKKSDLESSNVITILK